MTGRILGFKVELMKVGTVVGFDYWIVQREHFTFRKIGCELNLMLNDTGKFCENPSSKLAIF